MVEVGFGRLQVQRLHTQPVLRYLILYMGDSRQKLRYPNQGVGHGGLGRTSHQFSGWGFGISGKNLCCASESFLRPQQLSSLTILSLLS